VRVLLTTDTAGGVWSYTEELTDALAARGHRVHLVSFGGEPRPEHRAWLDARPDLRFTALPHPLEWMPEPEPMLSASAEALRRVAERAAPDVIHLNQFFPGAFDLGAPRLVVAHSDVVSWWRGVRGEEPPQDAWFARYRGWVRAGLQGADGCAAPTAWMAEQAERIYGAAPVRVVHNARSPDRFPCGGAERERRVVAVGRLWDEGKGVRDLAAAASLLRADAGAARVVVAGPAAHPAGGADFPVDTPGLRWAGVLPAPEVATLLGRSAVYAATSRYEPFGLAPLEAALTGCALVMTDIPTFRELWGDVALFYPPGDADALAGILRMLLADRARCDALAHAARRHALERFAPDRMAAEYEALYVRLLAAGDASPTADSR
jgi:glycogen synthase